MIRHFRFHPDGRLRHGWHEFVHWLHDPSMCGRSTYRLRHRIHLIPLCWLDRVCNRHDQRHPGL